jgi:hypothetical protein
MNEVTMNDTIKTTVERTRQYWYIDGFGEMLTGLVFLLLGIINVISGILAPSTGTSLLVGIGYPIIILGATFIGRGWVRSLKEKITYPRTGYVEYIHSTPNARIKRGVTAFLVAFVLAIVSFVFAHRLEPFWVTFGTGLSIAAFIIYLAMQVPLNRFYLLAIWTVAVSLLAAYLQVGEAFQNAILLGGCGLGWLTGGALSLMHYLRVTQPANPGLDEE